VPTRGNIVCFKRRRSSRTLVPAGPDHDGLTRPRRREANFNHGVEWQTLINTYIEIMPLSGDMSCVAEQITSG